ncbi:uncharacterized protein N7503_000423 [Penicillium pulvis]|uniref:uncharacterized protein n=1 Tax=Penicillium pulvis TaxID=1562058 RepID=UPI002546EBF5|nr:uncharacterized protein N7503_000423 [Penicillium pulvis]KAJ5813673.1 hypothetical protein N7503_000423 [Penicillium pulvis]
MQTFITCTSRARIGLSVKSRSLTTVRSHCIRNLSISTARQSPSGLPSTAGALHGIKVLDLTRALAGPFCTQILADYGADVIKVEQPRTGDDSRHWKGPAEEEKWKTSEPMSFYFASTNRNKRSITIDLKKEKGREIILDLAKECDVMVNNFIPGKVEQLGIGYDVISKVNPRIIYGSISGYGASGPYAKRAGYDLIAAAEAGLLHITGEPDGPPTKPGISIVDLCTGLYMHGALLAALEARNRTGKGQKIDGSLFETQIGLLANVAATFLNTGQEARRWGTGHPTIAPYSSFPTQDSYIVLGAVNDRQFKALAGHLDLPEIVDDPRFMDNTSRVQHRTELKQILDKEFQRKTTSEWIDTFTGSGMPYAPINNIQKALAHPQIENRELIETIPSDKTVNGNIRVTGIPVKFSDTKASVRHGPPLLGEHTREILQQINRSPEMINILQGEGVV